MENDEGGFMKSTWIPTAHIRWNKKVRIITTFWSHKKEELLGHRLEQLWQCTKTNKKEWRRLPVSSDGFDFDEAVSHKEGEP